MGVTLACSSMAAYMSYTSTPHRTNPQSTLPLKIFDAIMHLLLSGRFRVADDNS